VVKLGVVKDSSSFKRIVDTLPQDIREQLANRWSNMALAEHASVGSFSRFSLQLLSVGAPPEMLVLSHKAALDEIKHAKMCFAIASVYAGTHLSPGPLPLDGNILGDLDLPTIVHATIVEGCIGETISAMELSHAISLCKVPTLQKTLTTILEEESRHAQLAWGFVRWALKQSDTIKPIVKDAFHPILEPKTLVQPQRQPNDSCLEEHGQLGDHQRWISNKEAHESVILPAAKALLNIE
jgi:hypothetical protein